MNVTGRLTGLVGGKMSGVYRVVRYGVGCAVAGVWAPESAHEARAPVAVAPEPDGRNACGALDEIG
jgi:hypothetical protein